MNENSSGAKDVKVGFESEKPSSTCPACLAGGSSPYRSSSTRERKHPRSQNSVQMKQAKCKTELDFGFGFLRT